MHKNGVRKMQTNKLLQTLLKNLDTNPGSIFLHFTESIPSLEEINAYISINTSRVVWVQPYIHMQKEMYEATAVHSLPSQHICLPYWKLESIDNIFLNQRVYIEIEKIENISFIEVKSTDSILSILNGMTKTFTKESQIKNIIIRNSHLNDEVIKLLNNKSFVPSIETCDITIYHRA
jgi:hypothetical protein